MKLLITILALFTLTTLAQAGTVQARISALSCKSLDGETGLTTLVYNGNGIIITNVQAFQLPITLVTKITNIKTQGDSLIFNLKAENSPDHISLKLLNDGTNIGLLETKETDVNGKKNIDLKMNCIANINAI